MFPKTALQKESKENTALSRSIYFATQFWKGNIFFSYFKKYIFEIEM